MMSPDQRVLLAIDTPRTELTVGKFVERAWADGRNTVTTQYSGVSAYTERDIRFYAHGTWTTDTKQSDLIAQAKGQLWMQAIGNLVGLAGGQLLLSSSTSTMIAGQGGITVLAGFRPDELEPQPEAGELPKAVSSYENSAKIPTTVYGIFDTVMAVGLTALDTYLSIKGRPSGQTGLSAWGVQGSLANLAGASINIAGLSGSPAVSLPGINMFSQAGILVGSAMGCVNIIGLPGVLLQSTFTTQFGLITSGVRGLFSAGMTSLGDAGVGSLVDLTVRSSMEMTVASRLGTTGLKGSTIHIGKKVPTPGQPQLPTASIKAVAVDEISLESVKDLHFDAGSTFRSKAVVSTSFDGGKKVLFKVGAFEIKLDKEAKLGSAAGAKMTLGSAAPTPVTIEGPGGAAKFELTGQKAELSAGGGKQTIDFAKMKLQVNGVTFDIK